MDRDFLTTVQTLEKTIEDVSMAWAIRAEAMALKGREQAERDFQAALDVVRAGGSIRVEAGSLRP